MYKIGLDLGYGFTKGVADNGKTVCFPSIVALDKTKRVSNELDVFSIENSNIEENLLVNISNGVISQNFKVGELAAIKENITASLEENKTDTIENQVCIAAASALLLPEENNEVFLVSGLPIISFESQKEKFKSMLENYNFVVSLPNYGIQKKVKFSRVELIPQGLAAVYHSIWDNITKYSIPGTYIGLIDWGHKTVDYAVFAIDKKGIPIYMPEYSGSIDGGMFRISRDINNIFEERQSDKLEYAQSQLLVETGKIFFRRKWIDLTKELIEIKEDRARVVKNELIKRWSNIMNSFNTVFISGGGGQGMFEYTKNFTEDLTLELASDPQMGNALGYKKIAEIMEQAQEQPDK